ncbi:NUDIX domain-containing protein [Tissierella sp. MB52-C2]|uniref:NUDIX hydrolase n=1 Tax=Tissierella sp. MB52-C2 TaxID=3070999 RepID=UPI00280B6F5D|nr:NUDIX domain-containing protein [Tissierella sp. MB52-C2]WMM23973.1 NUDIX domain-containing protein [Tissierella sp. MB52-C2]
MIEYLGKEIIVKIDRPMGTIHPKHNFIYSINYGYIEGTKAGDSEEIDAYVLGVFRPIDSFKGRVIGIIKRNDDVEDKLVVAKELNSYDKYQIKALTEFQKRFFDSEIITLDYLRSSIRNTVRGLLRRESKVLVLEEEYKGEVYYYLPGGGIEFLETSEDALKREMKEELNINIIDYRLLYIISNIFEIDGINAHEIVQIYEIYNIDDEKLIDGTTMEGDIMPCKMKWIEIDELINGTKKFYPEELIKLL